MILTKRSEVMRFKVSDMLLSTLSLISCLGCSVKENRDVCPCQLVLDFSKVDTVSVKSIDLFLRENGEVILNDVVEQEEFDEDYYAYVPRTSLDFCAWAGRGDALTDDLKIPYGGDCPPVYIHSATIDAVGESVSETVIMRKNFCRVTMTVKMAMQSSVILAVIGNVDGFEADGVPSSGDFKVIKHVDGDNVFYVNLPRQLDASLMLEMDSGDEIVKRFPIGQYIVESGYDWKAPDLEDISIDLDLAVSHLSIVIKGWEKEYKFDVVI